MEKKESECYYEILQVKQDATEEEIRKSYKALTKKFHPDKNVEERETFLLIYKKIQQAYEVLSSPQERAFYGEDS